jgi:hypothetical protein
MSADFQSVLTNVIHHEVDTLLAEHNLLRPGSRITSSINAVKGKNGKDNHAFTSTTDLTHTRLVREWDEGSRETSCNSFLGWYARTIIPRIAANLQQQHQIPLNNFPTDFRSFKGFDLERAARLCRVPQAWVAQTADPSARPGYGDMVRWRSKNHVGVSLDIRGGVWHGVEGGQGGRNQGYDVVEHVTIDKETSGARTYNPTIIRGWVSLLIFFTVLAFKQPGP